MGRIPANRIDPRARGVRSGDSRRRMRRRRRQHHRRRRRRRKAHRRLRHPLSPVRGIGKTKTEFTGFDVELMEAIGEKIGREPEFTGHLLRHDLPSTSPRASSKRSPRPRRSPKNAKKTVDFTEPYYLSEQAILVKEGGKIDSVARTEGRNGRRPEGHHRRGIRRRKSRSRRTPHLPAGPRRGQRAQGGHRRSGRDGHPGGRKRGQEHDAGSKSPSRSRPKKSMESRSARANDELLEELNEGLAEIKEDGDLRGNLRKVVPPAARNGNPRSQRARSDLTAPCEQSE